MKFQLAACLVCLALICVVNTYTVVSAGHLGASVIALVGTISCIYSLIQLRKL